MVNASEFKSKDPGFVNSHDVMYGTLENGQMRSRKVWNLTYSNLHVCECVCVCVRACVTHV